MYAHTNVCPHAVMGDMDIAEICHCDNYYDTPGDYHNIQKLDI